MSDRPLSVEEQEIVAIFRDFYRRNSCVILHEQVQEIIVDWLIDNNLKWSPANLDTAYEVNRVKIERAIQKLSAKDLEPPKPAVQSQEPMVGVPGIRFAPERPESDFTEREILDMSPKDYMERVLGKYRY